MFTLIIIIIIYLFRTNLVHNETKWKENSERVSKYTRTARNIMEVALVEEHISQF